MINYTREWLRDTFLEYWWVSLLSYVMTYMPRLTPLKYAAISGMVIAGKEHWLIYFCATWWAVLWTMSLVFLNDHASSWIKKNITINKKRKGEHRISQKKRYWLDRIKHRQDILFQKLHIVNNRWMLFFLTFLWTYSVIPDILIIRFTKKKIGVFLFFVATVLGKSITNFLIVFWTEWVMRVFGW